MQVDGLARSIQYNEGRRPINYLQQLPNRVCLIASEKSDSSISNENCFSRAERYIVLVSNELFGLSCMQHFVVCEIESWTNALNDQASRKPHMLLSMSVRT